MSTYNNVDDLVGDILGKSYHVTSIAVENPNGLGSTQSRLKIDPKCTDDSNANSQWIFTKRNDQNSQLSKLLFIIEKESLMYSKIVPLVLKVLYEKNLQVYHAFKALLLCYYGQGIVSNDHIFLFEDFTMSRDNAFNVYDRDVFHNDETVHLVLRSIALYHSVFHALKTVCGIDFKNEFPILAVDYLNADDSRPVVSPFYNGEFSKTCTLLQTVFDCYVNKSSELITTRINLQDNCLSDIHDTLQSLKMLVTDPLKLMEKINSIVKDDTSILIHGDFHPLNIAISGEGSALFFDFQLIRYSDGVLDVHQYISQSCTSQQRKLHLSSYLETYHSMLTETCKQLGMTGSPYGNMAGFMREYQRLSPWQMVFGFGFLLWKFVTNMEAYHELTILLDTLNDNNGDRLVIQENIVKCVDKVGPKVWTAVQILFDFAIEMKYNGMIDELKNLSDL